MGNSNEHKNTPVWAFETIELKKPDPIWKDKGVREKEELYNLLSVFSVKQVEHIGSTAIPNLPAKPIIDLMASIPSLELIHEIVENLSLHEWHYVPPELDKQPWRRFFVKVKNDKRVAHLHLMQEGEERWEQQLKFRNKLRTNAHLAEEYATIKCHLAQEFNNDRESYTEAKTEFINKVLFN
ncbi:GrpB family protein [Paenisporosarcina quisquiliarum]|uniref:GrpB family protein n=1 Tax=Paenisporosarcina quisquiliarum TaxID=365346 RepID=A0A9X3LIP7_9BACL|nr:GrpB family protein [Paenisporosarcina quisquiliarum]MCZ8538150.1 GrpB family protein [Paenisporosarcina quisquiliarum]